MSADVFVSSVMLDFEEYRVAARQAVMAVGARPILVEDQPSRPDSPRNACLDLVASADAVVTIIANRGGSRAPSGKAIVEEEFDEAVRRGRPVFVFVQQGDRDQEAIRLANIVSDYTGGRYRTEFSSPSELKERIIEALRPFMENLKKRATDLESVQRLATEMASTSQDQPRLRLVLAPMVQDEIIDPADLDRPELGSSIMKAGHDVEFFSYLFGGKRPAVAVNALSIEESGGDSGGLGSRAHVHLQTSGWIVLERKFVSSEEPDPGGGRSLSHMFEIPAPELRDILISMFRFGAAIVEAIDPYARYPTWVYSVAMGSIGTRVIVDQRTQSNSYSAPAWGDESVMVADDRPRPISREAMRNAEEPASRALSLLRRRLQAKRS